MNDVSPLGTPAPAACFASGWVYRAHYNDIDAQAAHFRGYGQHYEQLSRGPFEGRFNSFDFGTDLAIHFERANRELAQSASTPTGRYGACLLAADSPPCALNAATLAQDEVVLCPAKRTLEGKTPEGMSIFCMDISAELLPDAGAEMLPIGVVSDPSGAHRLRELVQTGLSSFMRLESPAPFPAAARDFTSSLADMLWHIAGGSDGALRRAHHHRGALRVYRRARDLIHHTLADGISITRICREVGVSRRSLECAFRSVVDMSPAQYVRVLQLNRIRRDLLSAESAKVSIGVIAARHGVWHWSRLSHTYRFLFGELPSETRRRAQS